MNTKRIGILGAMPEEIIGIVSLLNNKEEIIKGMRTYYTGTINDIDVVVVFSRWGKVASATTVTHLIIEFGITELYFVGVAGAIQSDLKIGDIVIANSLVQHDMDARPLMQQFEIPLLGKTMFSPSKELLDFVVSNTNQMLETNILKNTISEKHQKAFSITNPKLFVGQIASGDKFFANSTDKKNLLVALPNVLCVEMEGAAVAQVCYEYTIPCIVIRTISDTANETSPIDFKVFVDEVASKFVLEIIKRILV
jgi:adenosylhomocysteine nucleosidase